MEAAAAAAEASATLGAAALASAQPGDAARRKLEFAIDDSEPMKSLPRLGMVEEELGTVEEELRRVVSTVEALPVLQERIATIKALLPAERGKTINALPPDMRSAVEAAFYVSGWDGPSWMDTSDAVGGFRQLHHFAQLRLAVSKSCRLPVGPIERVCRPPDGW